MKHINCLESLGHSRRQFVQAAAGSALLSAGASKAAEPGVNVFGPRPGYSPQIGTLVSEMIWMRDQVARTVNGLNQEQLDFLLDNKANRIGALLLHLAATERLYQLNTFDNVPVRQLENSAAFKEWAVAMDLGEPARQTIEGHDLNYYLTRLQEGREKTFAEFRKRDDAWLMAVDESWGWGPTNNLCKWFHVCEHESHHAGQIAMLKSRAPGAKTPANG
jgi:uncharacterized damage-inducible protein DinB